MCDLFFRFVLYAVVLIQFGSNSQNQQDDLSRQALTQRKLNDLTVVTNGRFIA